MKNCNFRDEIRLHLIDVYFVKWLSSISISHLFGFYRGRYETKVRTWLLQSYEKIENVTRHATSARDKHKKIITHQSRTNPNLFPMKCNKAHIPTSATMTAFYAPEESIHNPQHSNDSSLAFAPSYS